MNADGGASGSAPGTEPRPVLIVGGMRSGTSWVSEVLGRTAGVTHLHEPDNPWEVPFAARATVGLGALPVVERGGIAPALYTRLWDVAFGARRGWLPNRRRPLHNSSVPNRLAPSYWLARELPYEHRRAALDPGPEPVSLRFRLATRFALPASAGVGPNRVVKSVYVPLALEWLADRYHPRVLIVRRHPLDALASQVKLGWGGDLVDERGVAPRVERWACPGWPADGDRFAKQVWLVGFTASAYDELTEAHPEFHVVDHETLCIDPLLEFKRLVAVMGLTWSPAAEAYLESKNKPGDAVTPNRVPTDQAGKWRTILSRDQADAAREMLSKFPIVNRYPELKD